MKLKNFLLEKNIRENLWDLIHYDYQIPNNLIIRGTDEKIDKFKEKKIRKDRSPRDTKSFTDALVNGIEDGYYPNVPKRSESKFAGTPDQISEIQQYGEYIYYCFPHETADVKSLPNDAINYFDAPFSSTPELLLKNVKKDLSPCFVELLKILRLGIPKRMYQYGKNQWSCVLIEVDKLKPRELIKNPEDLEGERLEDFIRMIESVKNYVNNVTDYFTEMEDGVTLGSSEVIFDGPKYLIVERDYLSENFEIDVKSKTIKIL